LKIFLQRLESPVINLRLRMALKIILLTLCRKSELRLARWEHIDFARGVWEIPAELSKTGMPHIVYLSRQAVECLETLKRLAGRAQVVLPARWAVTQPICESTLNGLMLQVRWGIPHFTPHDLRRTGSTTLNELGYNADWIEKALNHSAKGIRGVYNRAQYGEQRRKMLQEWADWLERLPSGADALRAGGEKDSR
jgi:integrase